MDDAEARAILREHGQEPPARGKLNDHWHDIAESLRQDTPGPDYDGGVTEDDFAGVTEAAEPPEIDGTVVPAERRPRRVKASRPPLRERLKGKPQQGKARPKKRHPRIPVDRLISDFWAGLGGMVQRIDPPVGNCLVLQAPVAGLILEDTVKGTAADRVLQPVARAEDKAKAVVALVGPPMIVAALEHAATLPDRERELRQAFLMPLLERSLIMWARIAGDKAAQMAERLAEEGPAREQAAELMALIWPQQPAAPAPEPETVDA